MTPAAVAPAATAPSFDPRTEAFYARDVHAVARGLIGCWLRHGPTAGRIVETESYHEDEAACHAHIGLTARTATLIGPPAIVYVYRSYGIHALLNAVTTGDGVGAAVLIRALEPLEGVPTMRERRGGVADRDLCSGPGKLTQALDVGLELNGTSLVSGPVEIHPPAPGLRPEIVTGVRIGITKAADLPWRFCDASSSHVSRPWPPAMRRRPALAKRG